jgi:CubicO group peptidase (beta-lactamase class C family)/ribosomal protein S18 acetylase RimI-like enzyme
MVLRCGRSGAERDEMNSGAGEADTAHVNLPPGARLRAAGASDIPALAEVFVSSWRDGYVGVVAPEVLEALEAARIAEWLAPLVTADATTTSVVEAADGSLLAFCRFGTDRDDPGTGQILGLYVDPAAQRRGLASALLEHAITSLAGQGCSKLALWVFAANERAQRLYRNFGFVPDGTGRVEQAYGAPEIHMVRRLRPLAPPGLGASPTLEVVVGGDRLLADPVLRRLRGYLDELVDKGFPPSISLAIVGRDGPVLECFGGKACVVGEVVPTTIRTCYDLASLTKLVCTVTLVLAAAQRGELALDDPVRRFLPSYPNSATTLRHLLTHTAGLVDHRPFFATLEGREQIEAAVYQEARGAGPTATVRYSDLGFMLLGWALERLYGAALDELFASKVARPLGLDRTGFRPTVDRHEIAATELDSDQRRGPGLVWGEVHDGNAFALGGVAGHAGLFAPLEDLARYLAGLLNPGGTQVLDARSIAEMGARQAGTGDDVRSIGWRLSPTQWGAWPVDTIWHTGFTGTSLLVSPSRGVGVVLLTNAVHPARRLKEQAAVRARIHQLLAEAFA